MARSAVIEAQQGHEQSDVIRKAKSLNPAKEPT